MNSSGPLCSAHDGGAPNACRWLRKMVSRLSSLQVCLPRMLPVLPLSLYPPSSPLPDLILPVYLPDYPPCTSTKYATKSKPGHMSHILPQPATRHHKNAKNIGEARGGEERNGRSMAHGKKKQVVTDPSRRTPPPQGEHPGPTRAFPS